MHIQLFINGRYRDATNGDKADLIDPATAKPWASTSLASASDVEEAVEGAWRAFQSGVWADVSSERRSAVLQKAARLLAEKSGELAALESRNVGKPIREATLIDVPVAIQYLEWYARVTSAHLAETIPLSNPRQMDFTLRQPLGVVGAITPWNFPLFLAILKIGPALAVGNSVVLKPSEYTPVTTSILGGIFQAAGLPDGILQIVPGLGTTAGETLVRDPRVAKIFFTGGTATGQHIQEAASRNVTPVALELGGKSPNIVFADANWKQAQAGALFGCLLNAGQNCIAGARLLVERSIYARFTSDLARAFSSLRVGQPAESSTQIGPVTHRKQYERVLDFLRSGVEEGAHPAAGGPCADLKKLGDGFFVSPTLFVNAHNRMKIAQEEIFGPVLTAIPFEDEPHALELANQTAYGLGAGVFTSNAARAHRMARGLEAGTVYINTYNMVYPQSPFPSWKRSGNAVERGLHGLLENTRYKNVIMETSEDAISWFEG